VATVLLTGLGILDIWAHLDLWSVLGILIMVSTGIWSLGWSDSWWEVPNTLVLFTIDLGWESFTESNLLLIIVLAGLMSTGIWFLAWLLVEWSLVPHTSILLADLLILKIHTEIDLIGILDISSRVSTNFISCVWSNSCW